MIAPQPNHSNSALHLVAPPSQRQDALAHYGRTIPTLLLAASLNTDPAPSNPTVVITGDSSTKDSATKLGLRYTDHLTPILANPKSVKRQLLSRLDRNPPPTRITCWSDELISLAADIATHYDIPAELISTNPASITKPPQNIDTIRVFTTQDHDTWQSHRRTCQTDQLLASQITLPAPTNAQRTAARAQFAIDDHTIVIAAIADAPNQVDAREFAFLLGLLSVSGYKVLGLIPKTAQNLSQALRHHRGLDKPFRILTTTDPITQNLPLIDTYIHPNDHISGSTHLLDHLLQSADIPILNLRHSGKAGFSRAQGTAGRLLDEMDQIVSIMQSRLPTA